MNFVAQLRRSKPAHSRPPSADRDFAKHWAEHWSDHRRRYDGAWLNRHGLTTLCRRESLRFLSIFGQTIIGPVVSSLLFLAVFTFALGRTGIGPMGIPYREFLVPGLVMMTAMQNAFANTSSSLMTAKYQGNIVDLLTPPLSEGELLFGLAIGGVVRGLVVGATTFLALAAFQGLNPAAPLAALWFLLQASLLMSLFGILAGVWAEKWEQVGAVTNFVVVPLTFLSGTFYALSDLPEGWVGVASWNPLFYAVDGFRYGILGVHESGVVFGGTVLALFNLLLFVALAMALKRHWRLWA